MAAAPGVPSTCAAERRGVMPAAGLRKSHFERGASHFGRKRTERGRTRKSKGKPRRAPAFGPARHWRFAGGAFTPPLTKGMLTPPWNPSRRFPALNLLYLSTSLLWWQVVSGIIGVIASHALRSNLRCTWRHREGWRNVYNAAIRRALSPLCLCRSVTAGVHGCPRGVAPLRYPLAIRNNPVAHTGGETAHLPYHSTGYDAHSPRLFAPPGHDFPTRDAR